MFFVLSRAWDKEKILSLHVESNLRPSDFRSPMLYYFTELKTYHLFHSIHKNDAIDIANLSMQAACHMNFVIGLAHRRVSVAQWSEVRFLMGTQFFLCPTLVKRRKTSFSKLGYVLQTLPLHIAKQINLSLTSLRYP